MYGGIKIRTMQRHYGNSQISEKTIVADNVTAKDNIIAMARKGQYTTGWTGQHDLVMNKIPFVHLLDLVNEDGVDMDRIKGAYSIEYDHDSYKALNVIVGKKEQNIIQKFSLFYTKDMINTYPGEDIPLILGFSVRTGICRSENLYGLEGAEEKLQQIPELLTNRNDIMYVPQEHCLCIKYIRNESFKDRYIRIGDIINDMIATPAVKRLLADSFDPAEHDITALQSEWLVFTDELSDEEKSSTHSYTGNIPANMEVQQSSS